MKSAFRIEMLNALPSRGLEYAGSMEGQASQQSKACRATQLRAAAEGQGGPAAGFSTRPFFYYLCHCCTLLGAVKGKDAVSIKEDGLAASIGNIQQPPLVLSTLTLLLSPSYTKTPEARVQSTDPKNLDPRILDFKLQVADMVVDMEVDEEIDD